MGVIFTGLTVRDSSQWLHWYPGTTMPGIGEGGGGAKRIFKIMKANGGSLRGMACFDIRKFEGSKIWHTHRQRRFIRPATGSVALTFSGFMKTRGGTSGFQPSAGMV